MYARDMRQGLPCFTSDGRRVGTVREVYDTYFHCRTNAEGLPPDLYVPFGAVNRVQNDQIYLNVSAAELRRMNWQQPPSEGRMR